MIRYNTKVEKVTQDRQYVCLYVMLDNIPTQVVFDKNSGAAEYLGKDICLVKPDDGDYFIEDYAVELEDSNKELFTEQIEEIPFTEVIDETLTPTENDEQTCEDYILP